MTVKCVPTAEAKKIWEVLSVKIRLKKKCKSVYLSLWLYFLTPSHIDKTRLGEGYRFQEVGMWWLIWICDAGWILPPPPPVNIWGVNWGATCAVGWYFMPYLLSSLSLSSTKGGLTLVSTQKKKIERAWKTGREIVREKPLRGQKASGRNGRSFTWPPWSFHWCYLEHKHWHGIQRIWKSSHVSHYQLVNLIFLVSWDGLFIHEHPVETQRSLKRSQKSKKRENKEEGETVITSSYNLLC